MYSFFTYFPNIYSFSNLEDSVKRLEVFCNLCYFQYRQRTGIFHENPNSKPRLSDSYHIVIIYTLFKSRCPSVHENSKYSQKKTKRNSGKE